MNNRVAVAIMCWPTAIWLLWKGDTHTVGGWLLAALGWTMLALEDR